MDDLNGRFEIENINGRLEMDDSVWPLQLGGLDIMDRVRCPLQENCTYFHVNISKM